MFLAGGVAHQFCGEKLESPASNPLSEVVRRGVAVRTLRRARRGPGFAQGVLNHEIQDVGFMFRVEVDPRVYLYLTLYPT